MKNVISPASRTIAPKTVPPTNKPKISMQEIDARLAEFMEEAALDEPRFIPAGSIHNVIIPPKSVRVSGKEVERAYAQANRELSQTTMDDLA